MITTARLLQPIQVGPRATDSPESGLLPPRRPGLSCVMSAEVMGLLVTWTTATDRGQVLVPWSNVRDVYGTDILPRAAVRVAGRARREADVEP